MLLEYLLIFLARVCDVSLSTVRMLLVVRGKRYPAAAIGFVEASVYVLALTRVMRNISDPWKVLAYGLGFASGTLLGSFIEERLALGHVSLEVIPQDETGEELLKALRSAGYGVTVLEGQGMTGQKMVLLVSTDRKSLPRLNAIIEEFSPNCFMTVLETRAVRGGVIPYRKAK
ncbi:MAG TPA: DUF2179 domain-containing protein [Firmicutes bacterium]|uniref:UPF0316 protein IMF26_05285 n=1 Tax=Candidatus Fermentithermobacillus carboniphilus TaxID=3085328 RepID=A0AAT9LE82_9FIRM|nr:MAG: DUF2179 domain-containing protein [Candidatus Fermentithermobacillus carboniphilus]HHW17760.1 DUF2179 domain-containing protein [Candidatus Fermentithermobacillaceae bacterium]